MGNSSDHFVQVRFSRVTQIGPSRKLTYLRILICYETEIVRKCRMRFLSLGHETPDVPDRIKDSLPGGGVCRWQWEYGHTEPETAL